MPSNWTTFSCQRQQLSARSRGGSLRGWVGEGGGGACACTERPCCEQVTALQCSSAIAPRWLFALHVLVHLSLSLHLSSSTAPTPPLTLHVQPLCSLGQGSCLRDLKVVACDSCLFSQSRLSKPTYPPLFAPSFPKRSRPQK